MRATFLAVLLLGAGSGTVVATEIPAAWPQGWKDAYRQFGKFIEEQDRYLPSAGLEFLPDGNILISSPVRQGMGITFYRAGSQILDLPVKDRSWQALDKSHFTPDLYMAFLQGTGGRTLYPFVWFRVEESGDENQNQPQVRMIEPPSLTDDVWPSERLQRFLDFHIFPKRHRDDIFKKNSRVSPDLALSITPSGTILREKLDPALEKILCWRIYRSGCLIERSPAGGDVQHVLHSPGNYFVFVGIDGPDGFMPVSNCLHFPLFPTKTGEVEVLPTVTRPDRVPDFLVDVLPPDALANVLSQEWAQGEGYYNKVLVYGLNTGFTVEDPEKQKLLFLWNAWSWALWQGWDGKQWKLSGLIPFQPSLAEEN